MHRGYIKLWRRIEDNPLSHDPDFLALWVWLLLLANHKEKNWKIGYQSKTIKRGEFITSRKNLSEISGVQESKIERILNWLESEQQVKQLKTSKYRLIIINNYQIYQDNEQQIEQQVNNKWTTSEQQVNTTKEYKNDNNDKNLLELTSKLVNSKAGFGDEKINNLITEFETIRGFKSAGGKKDRIMAKHLLNNFTTDQLTFMLKYCDKPFAPRIGSLYDLWIQRGKILAGIKDLKNKVNKPKTVII